MSLVVFLSKIEGGEFEIGIPVESPLPLNTSGGITESDTLQLQVGVHMTQ